MTTTTATDPFWVDDHHDHDQASDGVSRYGAYLRDRADRFASCDDAGDFAALAWEIATVPIMSPGYVRKGWPRIQGVSFGYHEDGLLARVEIVAPLPDELARLRGYQSWDWETGNYWEPGEETLSRMPALLTTVTSLHVIQCDRYAALAPAFPSTPDTAAAKATVRALVGALNELLRPIMDALERTLTGG
jgi:hypothetical protein